VHRERQDALSAQRARRRPWRRLELLVVQLNAHPTQRGRERRPRARGAVGDESQPVPVGAQPSHRLATAGDRLAGDVEDAVDVQENRSHYGIPCS
jgi:hypothetical protein